MQVTTWVGPSCQIIYITFEHSAHIGDIHQLRGPNFTQFWSPYAYTLPELTIVLQHDIDSLFMWPTVDFLLTPTHPPLLVHVVIEWSLWGSTGPWWTKNKIFALSRSNDQHFYAFIPSETHHFRGGLTLSLRFLAHSDALNFMKLTGCPFFYFRFFLEHSGGVLKMV
jgi:hypothetical protein